MSTVNNSGSLQMRTDMTDHLERAPWLSGMPHRILDVPLWQPAKAAIQLSKYSWQQGSLRMEMTNPIPFIPDVDGKRQASGVLTYRDLDVLLAVTHVWIANGRDTSGTIHCELPEVLRWMGYDKDKTSAPYSEIKASLHRLKSCQIFICDESKEEDRELLATAPYDLTFTMLSESQTVRMTDKPGKTSLLSATLSKQFIELMNGLSQSIDIDIYAHLIRHPATRRRPLARVIWLAMARHRGYDGLTRCRPGWLAARYGDRRNRSEADTGTLIYKNAFNPKSSFMGAIKALADTEALQLYATKDGYIEGHYKKPDNLLRIRDEAFQTRFLPSFDFRSDEQKTAEGESATKALPAPKKVNPHIGSDLEEWLEEEGIKDATDAVAQQRLAEEKKYKNTVLILNREVQTSKSALKKAHDELGWSFKQMAHLMVEIILDTSLKNPGGSFRHQTEDKIASHYETPSEAVAEYLAK